MSGQRFQLTGRPITSRSRASREVHRVSGSTHGRANATSDAGTGHQPHDNPNPYDNPDGRPNQHASPPAGTHGLTNAHADCGTHSCPHADAHRDPETNDCRYAHPHSDADAHPDDSSRAHGDAYTCVLGNPQPDAVSNPGADLRPSRHSDTNSHARERGVDRVCSLYAPQFQGGPHSGPGRLQSRARALAVSPEPVEGQAGRIRRWFDPSASSGLTTNGFSRTLQSPCIADQGWAVAPRRSFT